MFLYLLCFPMVWRLWINLWSLTPSWEEITDWYWSCAHTVSPLGVRLIYKFIWWAHWSDIPECYYSGFVPSLFPPDITTQTHAWLHQEETIHFFYFSKHGYYNQGQHIAFQSGDIIICNIKGGKIVLFCHQFCNWFTAILTSRCHRRCLFLYSFSQFGIPSYI